MTLEELKNVIKNVSLSHKEIKDFYVGNDYNQAEQINHQYPMVFFELPYFINYNLNPYKQIDNVTFSINVFTRCNVDDIDSDHNAISWAKEIGDAIITYMITNVDDFSITSVNGISVREFTDDSVAGMRYEINILLPRTFCDVTDFNLIFN